MDRKTLKLILDNNDFFHVVQPIVNIVENKVFGYEFLFRSNHIQNLETFFQVAKQENCLIEVDAMSVKKALQTISQLKQQEGINWFINIQPQTLIHATILEQIIKEIEKKELDPSCIIFELNEDAKHVDADLLREAVEELKSLGFLIALDDVGKGDSSLRAIFELEPSLIKIDQFYTRDISYSAKKKKFISTFTQLMGNELKMIFEGIETKTDLLTLRGLGATLVQGYYLGKPKKLDFYL